jgi:protoheme IX farnesyltransferase
LPRRLGASLALYISLTKPRIISLLLFTSVAAFVAGPRHGAAVGPLLAVVGGGYLSAGGANALNCALEGDIDREMRRTRGRPVPGGRTSPARAAAFGLVLMTVAFAWLLLAANLLAAVAALAGFVWYVGVYTLWLKRRSSQNIVIGGAAGSFPPVVGWAAATGRIGPTALALAAVIFAWTPPHFWALATLIRDDYQAAEIPMLPVVASPERVARLIRRYAVATAIVSLLPLAWGGVGPAYAVSAVILGGWFVRLAWGYASTTREACRRLFHGSLLYLFLLFLALAVSPLL